MALATGNGQHAIRPDKVRKEDGSFSNRVRHFNWRIIFRPRTLLYTAIWAAVGIGMLFALVTRERLALNVLHDRNPQYVLESNGSIRNGYTVRILNMVPQPRVMSLTIGGLPNAVMKINGMADNAARAFEVTVEPTRRQHSRSSSPFRARIFRGRRRISNLSSAIRLATKRPDTMRFLMLPE